MEKTEFKDRTLRAQACATAASKAAITEAGLPYDAVKFASKAKNPEDHEKITDAMMGLCMATGALLAASGAPRAAALGIFKSVIDRCYEITATPEFQDEIRAKAKELGVDEKSVTEALQRVSQNAADAEDDELNSSIDFTQGGTNVKKTLH